ncbi:MAG: hypothetical protein E5W70_07290 [Mesorhizobium sp.]|nr:MAG: hypothetical protein E5W70_07290 [Mesorhizobium sp.]
MAFTMNGRLRCCGFIVLRHRPILSANGRHSKVDHGRAQERNPKQIHFRLRNDSETQIIPSNCGQHPVTRERR